MNFTRGVLEGGLNSHLEEEEDSLAWPAQGDEKATQGADKPTMSVASSASGYSERKDEPEPVSVLQNDEYMAKISSNATWNLPEVEDISDADLELAANSFSRVDSAETGTLTFDDFTKVLRTVHTAEGHVGEPGRQNMLDQFKQADVNSDERVDFNEFLRFHALYISLSIKSLHQLLR